MRTDSVIVNIFAEIKAEIQEEHDIELSIAEINDITSSQFSAAIMAFTKGFNVRLPHIGRFDRAHKEETQVYRKHLKEQKLILSAEEYAKERYRIQKLRIASNKNRAKNKTKVDIEEFLNADYCSDTPNIFSKLNKGKRISIGDFFNIRRRAAIDRLQGSENNKML